MKIARNIALDRQRRLEVRTRLRPSVPIPVPRTPEDEMLLSELGVHFSRALEDLPPRRREVFELVRFQGFSYQQVGETLGLTRQTVANHMSLALKDLRLSLADCLDDGSAESAAEEGIRSDG